MQFLFRSLWFKVPDFFYFVLLFGGFITSAIALGMIIYGIVQKKRTFRFRGWIVALIVSVMLIVLTATGKIAPFCSFGG